MVYDNPFLGKEWRIHDTGHGSELHVVFSAWRGAEGPGAVTIRPSLAVQFVVMTYHVLRGTSKLFMRGILRYRYQRSPLGEGRLILSYWRCCKFQHVHIVTITPFDNWVYWGFDINFEFCIHRSGWSIIVKVHSAKAFFVTALTM